MKGGNCYTRVNVFSGFYLLFLEILVNVRWFNVFYLFGFGVGLELLFVCYYSNFLLYIGNCFLKFLFRY